MNIGKAIKQQRQLKGLSQKDFSLKTGLSQSYLSHIENGKKQATQSTLDKISECLEMPLTFLVWKATDINDVSKEKQEAFKLLKTPVDNLINEYLSN